MRDDTDASGGNARPSAGSTYVFDKNVQGEWEVSQKLVSPIRRDYDGFGVYLSVSGNYLAVAAWGNDYDENETNYVDDAGAVLIYQKDGSGTWNFFQKIVSNDRDSKDYLGKVAISGNHLMVGVPFEEHDVNGANELRYSGSIYFFSGGVLGLDDVLSETNYQLYPNPTNDNLTIERSEFSEEESFEIYTLLGQEVISGNLTGNRTQISVADLSAGMYLLKTPSTVFRFIKN